MSLCDDCSPWRLCPRHYAKYLADAPKRADEKWERTEKMLAQQAKALARKRARKKRERRARAAVTA